MINGKLVREKNISLQVFISPNPTSNICCQKKIWLFRDWLLDPMNKWDQKPVSGYKTKKTKVDNNNLKELANYFFLLFLAHCP